MELLERGRARLLAIAGVAWIALLPLQASSDEDAAAAMARALQDPLASIKMLATDNTISFDAGEDEDDTVYNFQLQPVYSIATEKINYIPRAVIPIIGIEPGSVKPPLGPNPVPDEDSKWGLSDTIVQLFMSPVSDSDFKWGIGPQVSLETRTSDRVAGPGWGVGLAGIVVGSLSDNWSYAGIIMHHWGEEDDFESTTIQPMLYYNFDSVPGLALSYNNSMIYNHEAKSGDKWTVPLGVTLSRTWALKGGNGFDFGVGYYYLVESPEGAADNQLKLAFTWIFN